MQQEMDEKHSNKFIDCEDEVNKWKCLVYKKEVNIFTHHKLKSIFFLSPSFGHEFHDGAL